MGAAASPDGTGKPETPRCGAERKHGGTCALPAGSGTSHLGFGNCRFHCGATPDGVRYAARVEARHMAVELDMEPHDALLWCIRITAGEVAYSTRRISQLEEDALLVREEREREWTGGEHGGGAETTTSSQVSVHVWVEVRAHAVDRLAKFSKMALDAGVAERQVQLVERLGGEAAALIAGLFADLRLTPEQEQRAPEIVRRHLVALEGGRQAA